MTAYILKRIVESSIFFICLLISALVTYLLIFGMESLLLGEHGDTRGAVWWLWAETHGYLDSATNHLIAAPYGATVTASARQPVLEALYLLPARYVGEIVVQNLIVIVSFTLTAFATYVFLYKALKIRVAAFVGGLIFGFCPAAVMQAMGGHVGYAMNFGLPLLLLALFHNREKRTVSSAALVAAAFSLITATALYFGYFALYIVLFYIAYDYATVKNDRKNVRRNYLMTACFALLFILPFTYNAILEQVLIAKPTLESAGRIRSLSELMAYSARPLEYLIPPMDHPVIGRYVIDYVRQNLHGSNAFEQTLYLGVVPLGLVVLGVMFVVTKRMSALHREYFLFFGLAAVWMFFLSLPPLIPSAQAGVPTISYFAYKVAPMFRVYARFGILVNFFVACAASVVLAHLSRTMRKRSYLVVMAVVLPVLLFEYWSIPPHTARPVGDPPPVYAWLSKEPGDIIIAEYPMMPNIDLSFQTYLFWQRIHQKRMVNGAQPGTEAWDFFEKVRDLSSPAVPHVLKSVGVKYVIVHPGMYREGVVPEASKRFFPPDVAALTYQGGRVPEVPSGLRLCKTFGEDRVFVLE